MQDFSKRRHSRSFELVRLGGSILGVLLLAFLVVVSARAAWDMYGKFTQASEEREGAEKQLQALQERETQVSAAVEALSSPRGVEAEIRARFGVAKPGEGEIQIVRDEKNSTAVTEQSQNVFERMWRALFMW